MGQRYYIWNHKLQGWWHKDRTKSLSNTPTPDLRLADRVSEREALQHKKKYPVAIEIVPVEAVSFCKNCGSVVNLIDTHRCSICYKPKKEEKL